MAFIGIMAAISHIWFNDDPKLNKLQKEYSEAVSDRNKFAKPYQKLITGFHKGTVSAEQLIENKHVFRAYDSLNLVRKEVKIPLNAYVKSKEIGNWHNAKKLFQFIGIPLWGLLIVIRILIVLQFYDKRIASVAKRLFLFDLVIPLFFLVQALFFSLSIFEDYPQGVYNILAFTLSVLATVFLNKLIATIYKKLSSEVYYYKGFLKEMMSFTIRTKRNIEILAEEAINEANEPQIKDLLKQQENDFFNTVESNIKTTHK